jgi:penicillin-binding protein 1A
LSAAYTNIVQHGISQGGSTITQQLIKQNVLNSNESSSARSEAIWRMVDDAGRLLQAAVIEMYPNSIPYGQEAYGVDAAARAYFGYTDDSDSALRRAAS